MTHKEREIREAVLEGAGVELIPDNPSGYYLRIGVLFDTIDGRTAAECFLKLADILSAPFDEGRATQ